MLDPGGEGLALLVQPAGVGGAGPADDDVVEEPGVQHAVLLAGQVDHARDRPVFLRRSSTGARCAHRRRVSSLRSADPGRPTGEWPLPRRRREQVCQSTPRCRASADTVVSSFASASVAQPTARAVSLARRPEEIVLLAERVTLTPAQRIATPACATTPAWLHRSRARRRPRAPAGRARPRPPHTTGTQPRSHRTPPSTPVARDHARRPRHACQPRRTTRRPGRTNARPDHTYSDPCRGLLRSGCFVAPDHEGPGAFTPATPRRRARPRSTAKSPIRVQERHRLGRMGAVAETARGDFITIWNACGRRVLGHLPSGRNSALKGPARVRSRSEFHRSGASA